MKTNVFRNTETDFSERIIKFSQFPSP